MPGENNSSYIERSQHIFYVEVVIIQKTIFDCVHVSLHIHISKKMDRAIIIATTNSSLYSSSYIQLSGCLLCVRKYLLILLQACLYIL